MSLPPISEEQNVIVQNIEKNNVVVDAVAGSGKTTAALYIAKTYPKKSILLLTYNKKLRLETKEKIKKYQIQKLEVHTFHSFCVKYLQMSGYTDYDIIDALKTICIISK